MINLVTGPPCSGKTTHVAKHRHPESVVVDLDALAHALGYPDTHVVWNDPHPAIAAARTARTAVIAAAQKQQIHGEVWIIDADPHPTTVRILERLGARRIDLNPGRDECHRRAHAAGRDDSTRERINHWYASRPHLATNPTVKSPALGIFDR